MSTKRNVAANVGGRVWAALMSFAFVPFYLRFMGIEAYGLIGFFTSMLAVFFVLDMGLSTTISRELARLSATPEALADTRGLVHTVELVYWIVGVAISGGIVLAAPAIANHWLNVRSLPLDQTVRAVRLMGITAALRWPVSLYVGALMGLRQHVATNAITGASATLQGGGAVLVLWLLSPTVDAFFAWQIVAAFIQVALLRGAMWRRIALVGHRPRFSVTSVRSIMGFSAGVMGITLLSVILTQLDKFTMSRILPLDQFGYYALAGVIAATLNTAATAIYGAIFPPLSFLVATGDAAAVRALYHKSCQLLSVVIFPAGLALALFAPELLAVYVHDPVVAERTHRLLSLFAVGNIFLAVMTLPLALQLASGWTALSFWKNVISVAIFVPLLLLLVGHYGAIGAAYAWLALTGSYFVFEIQAMHRRLLPGDQWHWYGRDIGVPAIASLTMLGPARLLTLDAPVPIALAACVVASGAALLLAAALLPAPRAWGLAVLAAIRRRGDAGFAQD